MKNKAIITGVVTAIASSLCCITPVLALLSGSSGAASSFTWMEPFRPYLLGFTVLVLGFAWYQKFKPIKVDDCGCEVEKKSFIHSKIFLGIVTVFSIAMMLFPYYSSIFYSDNSKQVVLNENSKIKNRKFNIKGMTCGGCSEQINHAVNDLDGIIQIESSYENSTSIVKYDESQVTEKEIIAAINSTGYTVTNG